MLAVVQEKLKEAIGHLTTLGFPEEPVIVLESLENIWEEQLEIRSGFPYSQN